MSLAEALVRRSQARPDAPAIVAPDGVGLTYGELAARALRLAAGMRAAGLGPGSRVATALPDGPIASSTFACIVASAVAMPLNPRFTEAEFDACFEALRPDALVLMSGDDGPAARVAHRRGLRTILLHRNAPGMPGLWTASTDGPAAAVAPEDADGLLSPPEALAIVLQTSGTTGAPKNVPLLHRNICASARNVTAALRLTPDDRGLGLAPDYYATTLAGVIVPSLWLGACVISPPRFDAALVREWLDASRPTWLMGAPGIYGPTMAWADTHGTDLRSPGLRFACTGGANATEEFLARMEDMFGCWAVYSYGMTEAGPRVTHNAAPPGERRPNTVGRSIGLEIAIATEDGRFLPPGEHGEICIRGDTIMAGYEGGEEVNAGVFHGDWLRTGDLGYLDPEGYLHISGRRRELINRGGQKVFPVEVDNALAQHPDVLRALAFPMDDARLGEEVAAAVVLAKDATADEAELQQFAAVGLADYKVPRRIFLLDELPAGPTGKCRRRDLTEMLGRNASRPVEPAARGPQSPGEATRPDAGPAAQADAGPRSQRWSGPFDAITHIWAQVLDVPEVGPDDRFFDLGGDSLAAGRIVARVEQTFGVRLPGAAIYGAPTVRTFASLLRRDAEPERFPALVPLQPYGERPPLFFVSPGAPWLSLDLARRLDDDQPLYTLSPFSIVAEEGALPPVPELASRYVALVREARPRGPYMLGGVSAGGVVAWEMAQQMQAAGQQVGLVVLVDVLRRLTLLPAFWGVQDWLVRRLRRLAALVKGEPNRTARGRRRARGAPVGRVRRGIYAMIASHREAIRDYEIRPYKGRVTYIWATGSRILSLRDPRRGWDKLVDGEFRLHEVEGDHHEVLHPPGVTELARVLTDDLARAAQACAVDGAGGSDTGSPVESREGFRLD